MSTMLLQTVAARPEPFRVEGLGYVFEPPGTPLRVHADYLHRRSDEFTAEVLVERVDNDPPLLLHVARVNLTSTLGKKNFAGHLAGVVKGDHSLDVDFGGLLERFCNAVVVRERAGSPFYRAQEMPVHSRPQDVITRVLPGTGVTTWFAPQGTGKGWSALIACAAMASGVPFAGLPTRRVLPLYLDWEDSPDIWQERLTAVAIGMGLEALPDVRYRQCRLRLAGELVSVLRYVQDEHIGVVVVDSVGPAMGASEGMRWDDQTLEFFAALRHFSPLPILLIDHMTAEAAGKGPQAVEKAFGSIYKMAGVRAAWAIRKEQETDASEQFIAFYHSKHNHTRRFPAIGMRLCFDSDADGSATAVVAQRADVRDSEVLSRGLSQAEQCEAFLRRCQPATTESVAEALGVKPNAARAVLGRLRKRNRVMKFDDGRWGLSGGLWEVV